jgi:hypothetical protein
MPHDWRNHRCMRLSDEQTLNVAKASNSQPFPPSLMSGKACGSVASQSLCGLPTERPLGARSALRSPWTQVATYATASMDVSVRAT